MPKKQSELASVTPAAPTPLHVRALKVIWYGLVLREPGEVFTLSDPSHFSAKSMEDAGDAPDTRTLTRVTRPNVAPMLKKNAADLEDAPGDGPTGDADVLG